MPSDKHLSDTWKNKELKKSLKSRDERSKTSSTKTKDDSDRRKEKRRNDDDREKKHKETDKRGKADDDKERRRKKTNEIEIKDKIKKEEKKNNDDQEKRRQSKTAENDEERRRKKEEKRHRAERDDIAINEDGTEVNRNNHRRRREETSEEREKRREERRRKREAEKNNHHYDKMNDRSERRKREETSEERRQRHEERKERKRREKELEEEERKRVEEEIIKPKHIEIDNNITTDDVNDNYDDDFEDYEDDFDDDDAGEEVEKESEVNEIMKAMNAENDRLLSVSNKIKRKDYNSDSEYEEDNNKANVSSTYINFVSAKQRVVSNSVMSKTRKRGCELLKLIELDSSSFDMFDMPPVNEYEMYIRNFGRANTQQAYIQSNEDDADKEIQTEEIDYREKWTQHPAEGFKVCGSGDGLDESVEFSLKKDDTKRMNKFLSSACQAVLILLEENLQDSKNDDCNSLDKKKSRFVVSEEYIQLAPLEIFFERPTLFCIFSPVQSNLLLTVHKNLERPSSMNVIGRKGLVCVWNVSEPSFPQKILTCESEPRCACFSPNKATLAFSGLADGSLVVWDLRENSSFHNIYRTETSEYILRGPTYNTASILESENHQATIISVLPIISPKNSVDSSTSKQGSGIEGLTFQIATLDESGCINLWVVAEISNSDPGGSQSDFGLAPGGRVKLIKSSTINLESPIRDSRLRTRLHCTEFSLLPSDPSHFYVTTNIGCIIHGVRYGGKAPPKAYRDTSGVPLTINCIDFSPFTEPIFLVGCENGEIRMYHIRSELPLTIWPDSTQGRSIKFLRFCRSRPAVFFVVDELSNLYIWDLNMFDSVPAKVEKISEKALTAFALSNDHSVTGQGLPGRRPQMILAFDDSTIEVHTLTQKFSALFPEEVEKFTDYIDNIL